MEQFPAYASDLPEPCTKSISTRMLRNRRWKLLITRYKKDKGVSKFYMYDPWASPSQILIGSFPPDESPNWPEMYDKAMEWHLETKEVGRY